MKAHDPALDSAILALVIGDLEPPVQGRFESGVGAFYADDTLRGKPIRVRFLWSHISATSTHWETNWITDFERMP